MKRILIQSGLSVTLAMCSFAQQEPAPPAPSVKPQPGTVKPRPNPRGDETIIPLPIQSARSIPPGPLEPMTPKEKAALTFRNVFYPIAISNRLLIAGWDHLMDSPTEWPGTGEGFGMRLGNRMGSLAIRNAIQLAGDLAFKTEPRYDRCACSTFMSRTGHAWVRVLTARKDSGGETVAIARITAQYATPWVTYNWYPDRLNTTGQKLQSGSTGLLLRGGTNMIREFWPDIATKLHLPQFLRRRDDR